MGEIAMAKPETHFQQIPVKLVLKIAKLNVSDAKKITDRKNHRAQTSSSPADYSSKGGRPS
jgi:hypothetical protein